MNSPVADQEALFVIHQDADLEKIRCIIQKRKFRHIFVLTTHLLLGKEQQAIEKLAPRVRTATLASLLTDAEMADCDRRATDKLLLRLKNRHIQRTYMGHFINESLWYKNALALDKLKSKRHFFAVYYSPGLGIHSRFWAGSGGKSLETAYGRFKKHTLPIYGRKIRNILKKRNCCTICHNGKCYLFVSTMARLRFSGEIPAQEKKISRITWLLMAFAGNRGRCVFRNRARRETPDGHPLILCTTIHNYVHTLAETGLPLLIFVDGHHPSNYPRTYIDMYTQGRFVVRNMIAETWFRKHGKEAIKPPSFMDSAQMVHVRTNVVRSLNHILLALNHAGDWSALINRSDTDLLVEAFSRLAQSFPDIQFTVRPHPTMATFEHEGKNAINRIHTFVRETGFPNLIVSENALSADLQKTQLVLSEYSQVLIDAYHRGNLGLVVNLTGRRSFMQDYEAYGFPAVYSETELTAWIKDLMEGPEKAVLRQNLAVTKFNQRLLAEGYH